MMPVAIVSCSNRVFPIAEIDSQVRRQMPTDNLKALITVIDDEEWLMVRRPCGGIASRRTHWYLPEILPQEESNLRPSGLLANIAPLYHLLAAKILQENLASTTMSPSLWRAAKANTSTDG